MDWRIQSINTQEALPTASGVAFYPGTLSPDRRSGTVSRVDATKIRLNSMSKRVSGKLADRCRLLRSDLAVRSIDYTALRIAGWLIRYPAHRRWLRTIGGPTTRSIVQVYPRIMYRPSTSYLYLGTTWTQRLDMLETHYTFLNRRHSAAFFDSLIVPGGNHLWTFAKSEHSFDIAIEGPCRVTKHREGELGLSFSMDGVVLYKISFSIVPAALFGEQDRAWPSDRLMLYVGRVQGTPHEYEAIRTATAACHASTPRDLLMNALFGIADAWGIEWIGGVSSDRQLSTGAWSDKEMAFNYDRWWETYEARRSSAGHYLIDLPERDSRYSGRLVSRTRHKKRLKRGLRTAVAEAIRENEPATRVSRVANAQPYARSRGASLPLQP